ncbi:hypothetical protein [Kriegella aquimaris]|uniref:hypothetical protein n=1 Tax=Kriegella aquimaris TaxID=192904 RepID=UPI00373FE183
MVGYDPSDNPELNGCLSALNKTIYNAKNTDRLIHHSDRGIQYCNTDIEKKENRNLYDRRKLLLRKRDGRKCQRNT